MSYMIALLCVNYFLFSVNFLYHVTVSCLTFLVNIRHINYMSLNNLKALRGFVTHGKEHNQQWQLSFVGNVTNACLHGKKPKLYSFTTDNCGNKEAWCRVSCKYTVQVLRVTVAPLQCLPLLLFSPTSPTLALSLSSLLL